MRNDIVNDTMGDEEILQQGMAGNFFSQICNFGTS